MKAKDKTAIERVFDLASAYLGEMPQGDLDARCNKDYESGLEAWKRILAENPPDAAS